MTSREHFDSNVVEVDGVRFETLIPKRVLTIPNSGTKVRVKFGIRVTNLSPIPYRFVFFYLIPELQKSDGQSIQNSYVRNATKTPAESDFLLAKPTDRLTFFLIASFTGTTISLYLEAMTKLVELGLFKISSPVYIGFTSYMKTVLK